MGLPLSRFDAASQGVLLGTQLLVVVACMVQLGLTIGGPASFGAIGLATVANAVVYHFLTQPKLAHLQRSHRPWFLTSVMLVHGTVALGAVVAWGLVAGF